MSYFGTSWHKHCWTHRGVQPHATGAEDDVHILVQEIPGGGKGGRGRRGEGRCGRKGEHGREGRRGGRGLCGGRESVAEEVDVVECHYNWYITSSVSTHFWQMGQMTSLVERDSMAAHSASSLKSKSASY